MFIADALRKGPNLLITSHGGSVASNAMIYRHRASPGDHNKVKTPNFNVPRKKARMRTIIHKKTRCLGDVP